MKGYELDRSKSKFHSYLNDSCSFTLEGSYYKNKLTKLSDISVKVLPLWLNIVEVVRNEDALAKIKFML
ncbi:hypothetical protein P3X46_007186 [Hevea brasiliensis]|uniref:Uncharacterized protein n=1 Tax=Hevea brasiliensis TaxID=3981 RepID=A0ABQ9MTQ2_HEVBR|nr:hypothetical protein P3X46_007186 [Hevea brasiliensis]